jgi:hypothetical protein
MNNQDFKLGNFEVDVQPRGDYELYTISHGGVAVRKQISRPSIGDAETGLACARRKAMPRGFDV